MSKIQESYELAKARYAELGVDTDAVTVSYTHLDVYKRQTKG